MKTYPPKRAALFAAFTLGFAAEVWRRQTNPAAFMEHPRRTMTKEPLWHPWRRRSSVAGGITGGRE